MELLVILVFVLGYICITLEHTLKIDKLIPAIIMMAICWAIVSLNLDSFTQWYDSSVGKLMTNFQSLSADEKHHWFEESLLHHLGKTAEILVFLLGAMTIVEMIDYFNGFASLKRFIKTRKKRILLWIVSILAFILSAIIDNLTATIVLITILRKIVPSPKDRLWFAGMIVIAANAGGAWSPIGDVTTTMLWIANKVSVGELVSRLLLPSIVCMILPVFVASKLAAFQGEIESKESDGIKEGKYSFKMLMIGLLAIVFVPVFKVLVHVPPYVGMMLSLGVVGIFAEIFSKREFDISHVDSTSHHSPVHRALSKIELPSILFFLGILMAVASLESLGELFDFADWINGKIPDTNIVVMILGGASAVIDNVPLVAASIGMFTQPQDSALWHFIAYAAGTGGSMLIIGSAAGVVAMGMERIDFFWYLKKISWLALIGYLAGAAVFYFFFR